VHVINNSSSSAPKGTVISMSPGPGSVVHARSVVTIRNSSR
jgi:beta-lactam-binding protein with PASTA domain